MSKSTDNKKNTKGSPKKGANQKGASANGPGMKQPAKPKQVDPAAAKIKRLLHDAEAAMDALDDDKVVECCEAVMELDSKNVDARMLLAQLAYENEDLEAGLSYCEEILEIEPEALEVRLMLGQIHLALGQPEETIRQCELVLADAPDDLDARVILSRALMYLGARSDALEILHAVVEEQPDDPDLLLELGSALYESLELEEALKVMKKLVKINGEDAESHWFLGLILERMGKEAEAQAELAKATRLDPEAFPTPPEISVEEMEKGVEEVLLSLPEKLRSYLKNVPISIAEIPSEADLKGHDPSLSPAIWGLFRGECLETAIADPYSHLPSEIVLYRTNLLRAVDDREGLLEEVKTTLLHEIAHFLGLNEEQVAELGLE